MKVTKKNVVSQIIREKVTSRGGGVEISLDRFGFPGERMAAYQNHLGGGLLGRVMSNDTIRHTGNVSKELQYSSESDKLDQISEILKEYFHELTNPEGQEWEEATYEENQQRPGSAY